MTSSPSHLEHWMRQALALAEQGRGAVEPNPLVGAVVLDADRRCVGEGWHRRFGQAHAEVNALAEADDRARGGTLIVTLEPCCHWGKTPPCTEAIKAAGIRHVVAAMVDPFPKVAGGGLGLLREAGLQVTVGVCETEARRLNAPFLKLLRTGQPWIHLKWAMTLDGRIATRAGDSKWISGAESRRRVHELRGRMDAIIVGRGTVWADDPSLTARPPGPRVATRVVISASGDLPEHRQLRATARDAPVLIFTAEANVGKLAGWAADGSEIVGLPVQSEELSIAAILDDLGRRKMTNVLVEGGAGLLGSFLDARAADELHVFIAPKIVGGVEALPAVLGMGVERIAAALALADCKIEILGEDVYVRGVLP